MIIVHGEMTSGLVISIMGECHLTVDQYKKASD